jgi:chromosomal replication initiator protein
MEKFRTKYREIDVLLVDSLHLLSNRMRTQEELCAVLDHLTAAGCQVVIASQTSPLESAGLLDSLRSRLALGLVVELGHPDIEIRKTIVRLMAEAAGRKLPRDVVFTLAHRITHDIRALKGAVTRVLAHRPADGCEGGPLPLDELLFDLAPGSRTDRCSLDEVKEHVTAHFKVEPKALFAPRSTKEVKKARQMAIYLARQWTEASLQEIADALGATANQVQYAMRAVKDNLDDPVMAADVEALHSRLGRTAHSEPAPARTKKERRPLSRR